MSKNITISEGDVAKVFTGVKKITTAKSGGSGFVDWVPEDEAINYVDLDTLDVYENGTYTASGEGCQAFSGVNVNVQPDLTTKGIDTNGTYNASDDGAQGYSSVTVDVKANTGKATFTRNGTYHSSSDQLDGYSEVKVNVAGGGGGSISGTRVEGIAASNLNAGQTVHVYSEGGGVGEGIPATLDPDGWNGSGAFMCGGMIYWSVQSYVRRKSDAYIQESGHYEQVKKYPGYGAWTGPFYISKKDNNYNSSFILTVDNFEGIDTTAELGGATWGDSNGNLFVTNTGVYDRNLRRIMSYPAVTGEAFYWGKRVPIDTGRYWGGTLRSGDTIYEQIAAIGTWQVINTYNLIFDATEYTIQNAAYTSQRKFYITKPVEGDGLDVFTIAPTGSQNRLMHIPKKYCQVSNMSPSGSHVIIVGYDSSNDDSMIAYKLNDDGTYQQLRWPVNVLTQTPIPSDEGFFIGSVYYPYGATGSLANYIAGTGSKSARGQLGIASASVAAGVKTSAIVLFS